MQNASPNRNGNGDEIIAAIRLKICRRIPVDEQPDQSRRHLIRGEMLGDHRFHARLPAIIDDGLNVKRTRASTKS